MAKYGRKGGNTTKVGCNEQFRHPTSLKKIFIKLLIGLLTSKMQRLDYPCSTKRCGSKVYESVLQAAYSEKLLE